MRSGFVQHEYTDECRKRREASVNVRQNQSPHISFMSGAILSKLFPPHPAACISIPNFEEEGCFCLLGLRRDRGENQ